MGNSHEFTKAIQYFDKVLRLDLKSSPSMACNMMLKCNVMLGTGTIKSIRGRHSANSKEKISYERD